MTCALIIGLFLLPAGSVAPPAEARKVDKKLLRRFETDICANKAEDSWHVWEMDRLQAVEAMGEPGRQALLYMAEGRQRVNTWNRGCAIRLLGKLSEMRAVPILREILADGAADPDLRADAIDQLTALKDVESLPALIAIVQRHDIRDRAYTAALRALGKLDDERARAALRAALVDPSFPEADRGAVMSRIGGHRDKLAIPTLVAMARTNDEMRLVEVAWALTRIGTTEGLAAAREVFTRITEQRSRDSAAREMLIALAGHRLRSQDPAELAEVEALTELVKRSQSELSEKPH